MARSINTGLTTLFTLIALFLLGGATIEGFALALIIGVAAGGYSSIFTASPIVVTWYEMADEKRRGGGRTKSDRAASKAAVEAVTGVSRAEEDEDEEEDEAGRPSARQTMKEAERAAQEEKRRKRRERRKKEKAKKQGRQPKKRF
jgi:hypothetical protein